jgi:phosphoribosyl-AMP cyclohydrolase
MVEIDFQKTGGLIPAIVQDHHTGDVLMLGFMNADSLAETQRTGELVFFSRSRGKLWKKGESSGHLLRVRELLVDCDLDTILVRVEPRGPGVCHLGYKSCFFRRLGEGDTVTVIAERVFSPEETYRQESGR